MIGIYKITSTKTGRIYIGQAEDIETRWLRYYTKKIATHPRLHQEAINYGMHSLKFEIIHICTKELLNEMERYYQDLFDVCGPNGLNCRLTTTKEKPGYIWPETREKLSQLAKNRIPSRESIMKTAEKNRGKKRSQEFLHKMAELNKHKIWSFSKLLFDANTGIYYDTIKDAALCKGMNVSSLTAQLNGRYTNTSGLIYAFPDAERDAKIEARIKRVSQNKINPITTNKTVINLETGVFYQSSRDAAHAHNLVASSLAARLNGRLNNNTSLIYA